MKIRNYWRRPFLFMAEFLRLEAVAGGMLMFAAIVAVILANSSAASLYHLVLSTSLGLPMAHLSILEWINDGLMAVFFLLVGLEIKRELLVGELSNFKQALLPGVAAFGGMLVPAVIYVACNWNSPSTLHGWAIPAATDIAFALGVLALLGRRVPYSLKVFLTALAILDDLGAIVIIGLVYTAQINILALILAGIGMLILVMLNRMGVRYLPAYLLVGLFLWGAMLLSGIHATLAGVVIACAIPLSVDKKTKTSPLHQLEHNLHPIVAYGILPIFALANAGISFSGVSLITILSPLPLGIAAGLFVGKQLGVMGAMWLAVKRGWTEWPKGASLTQVYGVAVLCGIGFTMSLFIGGLSFEAEALQHQVRLGVLCGSILSAIAGFLVLRFAKAS